MARIVSATNGSESLPARAVERAKAGDRDALAFLYARYADDVCSYLQGVVSDVEEAGEIAQCVFAQLARALADHQERNVPFLAWLLRFAREIAADQLHDCGLPRPSGPSIARAIRPLSRSAR
jgi:DNA-directed RNA polymerase specialized sigma24 family protein